MYTETAQPNVKTGAAQTLRASRPMEGISAAADRAGNIADRVAGILSRVQNRPEQDGAGAAEPLSLAYLDQVSRLHGNLDLLDKLTTELADLV